MIDAGTDYKAIIDAIEIRHYRLPLDPPFRAAWDPQPRTHFGSTIVRVRAGDYEGVGSGDAMLGFGGHEHLFLGHEPFDIERHVAVLNNLQFHYGRMWPLEIALWDLMGKISGLPMWKLLGGDTHQVRVYASTGERLPVFQRTQRAIALKEMGFPALKLRFYGQDPQDGIAITRAVREAVGDDMHILVDANQAWHMPGDVTPSWDLKTALWVADALAELEVFWLEEPLHRHDYSGLAELRRRVKTRIAGGEGNRDISELRSYIHHRSLDVYQPDVAWSTGIWQGREIAHEVRANGGIYSPHTWGDGLVLLANLHVAAAVSTAPFLEYPYDPPTWTPERRDFNLPQPIPVDKHGMVTLSDRPGLGVQLDWEALEEWRER